MHDEAESALDAGALHHGHLDTAVSIVSAYVSHNSIRAADLRGLIESVFQALESLSTGGVAPAEPAPLVPAVPIKKSITPDYLICLEDGKKFRSLKRHLGTVYQMTPDQYRAKWSLPRDYPMVAPAYSEVRSKLAKDIGLGRPARAAAARAEAEESKVSDPVDAAAKPAARSRKKKATAAA